MEPKNLCEEYEHQEKLKKKTAECKLEIIQVVSGNFEKFVKKGDSAMVQALAESLNRVL
ncbi:hypothetical protein [Enterococcus mundtii]|uniref:hypothetical protein n=1 Tax=Enterococcus mundtii TaxID=53346 RepID=UPI0015C313FD|nr:hypothetical protein [Enterococcus mundtii]